MRGAGGRYETCAICGLSWNVSKDIRIRYPGYICPRCTGKERSPHNDKARKPAASDGRERSKT